MSDTPRTETTERLYFDGHTWVDIDHSRQLETELAHALAEVEALRADAERWKEMAEFQYAVRAYPNDLDLGIGALDEYMKGWSWEAAIDKERSK